MKKKILVIPPDTPHPSYIDSVLNPLSFLHEQYDIHALDSLSIMEELPNDEFYSLWEQKLKTYLPQYDAFFGFSFGGVILQQCFSLFVHLSKPVVLFSTPSFADKRLAQKLNEVITLCEKGRVNEALQQLYRHVYYPNDIPEQQHQNFDNELAAQRVIFGLKRVLETDSRAILNDNHLNHWHLIGELSQLVNAQNVIAAKTGQLITVPKAGMRMLRDNPSFCQHALLKALNHDT